MKSTGILGIIMAVGILTTVRVVIAQVDFSNAEKVKNYYADWLKSIPGVSKIETGPDSTGAAAIKIHITAPLTEQLPDELNGIPVQVVPDSEEAARSLAPQGPYYDTGTTNPWYKPPEAALPTGMPTAGVAPTPIFVPGLPH